VANKTVKTRSVLIKDFSAHFINFLYLIGLKQLKRLKPVSDWLDRENFLDRLYKRINYVKVEYPSMKKETRKKLIAYYKKDIQDLEDLLELDLSMWRETF
jgi:hypothetical protein